ncbi:phosphoribosylglycinamide formyltransferase [Corynebacterium pseudodiphtheriticum]|uniref:phosphoribosylglycinamide formyltransferase n=1 Tax=Corynebacterium pseudodiphtheriticum TaxID=37637 RepID=UPI0025516879|nr:phosphoribosylglycinamide formyltransferase [Corynebacterium pseudodiphtheriticum]MDK8500390.1 phosphoribosylglycinamide formyltransferase [Corynebacterium pseudodiphtheriticum]MDK8577942.1 phosphoribosylglycinamide formyltransferase [Corynebacterium pseudodiphtheriticum]MDK8584011.1 phosphoribosylglycinamide formyltransferase [Corynebacterium pseudodiphtheriticum]MDK8701022.1 phosphoribosylglycinamide formyltransferase [Corynebacterium pseudodiphtheriticum]MDK8718195.1 phosphoribosylglycin
MNTPLRLTALVSGSGTLLQALLDNQDENYAVVLVVSDRECPALDRARAAGVETAVVPMQHERSHWDEQLAKSVGTPDLIVSAGFMKILGPSFVQKFRGRLINTHPALLPSFPGAHAVRDALDYGVKITGSTVHYVDEGVDTGPIIAQRAIDIQLGEREDELHERIKKVERELLVALLQSAEVEQDSKKVVFHHN